VADAMQSVIWRVLIFYVGSIFLVVSIVAWNDKVSMQQPYVSVLRALHVPGATLVMSAIILTAVLSALNSGLFASSRMLMALAVNGDAPKIFAKIDARGVPAAAILAGTAFAYLAVVMSYVSPDKVFAFLVTSYGTVAIFVYVLIAVSELKLRKRLEIDSPERLRVRMWGFPHLTRLAIAGMLAIVAAMGFISDQRAPLLFGLVSVAVMLMGYGIRQWVRSAGTQRGTP
jgi:GABA permease